MTGQVQCRVLQFSLTGKGATGKRVEDNETAQFPAVTLASPFAPIPARKIVPSLDRRSLPQYYSRQKVRLSPASIAQSVEQLTLNQ